MNRIRESLGARAVPATARLRHLIRGWAGWAIAIGLPLGLATPAWSFDPTAAERVIGPYGQQAEISTFVNLAPRACFQVDRSSTLCEWVLNSRYSAWSPLARATGTEDQINLLCVLPTDGSRREAGSCRAYPRRSNRSAYSGGPRYGKQRKGSPAQRQQRIADLREQARRDLDGARSLLELSYLVGAAPSDCGAITEQRQICRWRTTSHSFGHGTLAATIEASATKKVLLQCDLPTDGSVRHADACFAAVGD